MTIKPWKNPPPEIWRKIFSAPSLTLKDLTQCLRVSREWQKNTLNQNVGKRFLDEHKRPCFKELNWLQTYKYWFDNTKYTLIVDGTTSMTIKDCKNDKERWQVAKQTTASIARKVLSIYPEMTLKIFCRHNKSTKFKKSDSLIKYLKSIKQPRSSGQLTDKLKDIISKHFQNKTKCSKIIVVSDLEIYEKNKLTKLFHSIDQQSKKDKSEIHLTFIQLGKAEYGNFLANIIKFKANELQGFGINQNNPFRLKLIKENELKEVLKNSLNSFDV